MRVAPRLPLPDRSTTLAAAGATGNAAWPPHDEPLECGVSFSSREAKTAGEKARPNWACWRDASKMCPAADRFPNLPPSLTNNQRERDARNSR